VTKLATTVMESISPTSIIVKLARMTPVASGMRPVAVAPLLATGLTTPLIIDADYI